MRSLFGSITREHHIKACKKAVARSLEKLLSENQQIEKGLSYSNGIEILSRKQVYSNFFFDKRQFTCFCKLKGEEDETKLELKIKTYWYVDFSLLLMLIMILIFLAILIYDNHDQFLSKRGESLEIGLIFFSVVLGYAFFQNHLYKKEGVKHLEQLILELKSMFSN